MAVKPLTHEEADRRILAAMKPQQQSGQLLEKFREITGKRKAGATPPVTKEEVK